MPEDKIGSACDQDPPERGGDGSGTHDGMGPRRAGLGLGRKPAGVRRDRLVAGYGEFWARLGFGALAVAAFLALGVASLVLTRIGSYAPWMAFAFTAADVAIIMLAVAATLHDTGLGGNWIAIAPALWAAPLILAVGALRYRPGNPALGHGSAGGRARSCRGGLWGKLRRVAA